jgi:hypothetical protein
MNPLMTRLVGKNFDYFLKRLLDGEVLVNAAEFA